MSHQRMGSHAIREVRLGGVSEGDGGRRRRPCWIVPQLQRQLLVAGLGRPVSAAEEPG